MFPTATKDKTYVGKQRRFDPYKKAQRSRQASRLNWVKGMSPALTMTYETAGPQHIQVGQFQGFGPIGRMELGDW